MSLNDILGKKTAFLLLDVGEYFYNDNKRRIMKRIKNVYENIADRNPIYNAVDNIGTYYLINNDDEIFKIDYKLLRKFAKERGMKNKLKFDNGIKDWYEFTFWLSICLNIILSSVVFVFVMYS